MISESTPTKAAVNKKIQRRQRRSGHPTRSLQQENAAKDATTIRADRMKRNARANQEVIRHLTAILADEDVRKNFPSYLPFIQRIINSQVNSRTNLSPTQMILGNAINSLLMSWLVIFCTEDPSTL